MQKITLNISGMSCGHCLNAVRSALGRTPGVTVDSVTMGRATVEFDPGKISADKITAAVSDAGYRAEVVVA